METKELKEFAKNPRKISAYELKQLALNIKELGDLSGITIDVSTNEIITGNQRAKAIDIEKCEFITSEEFKKPDNQGTVAIGSLITEGGVRMTFRKVKWNQKQRDKANITANKLGGEWDWSILKSDDWDKNLLVDSGFDYLDFDQGKVEVNAKDQEKAGRTRTTKFFTLEVLFANKNDYVTVTEIINKSKKKDESIAETLKRLLQEK